MRNKTWVVSDTHFGHKLMANAVDKEGNKIRPWATVEEHDEALIDGWNALVNPEDRVYHLGDVAINRKAVATLGRCHGKVVLIKGNHDIFKLKDYLPFVDDIRSYRVFNDTAIRMVFSHIPLHESSIERFRYNVHGHVHHNSLADPRYRNVCVEKTNYVPIALDQLIAEGVV